MTMNMLHLSILLSVIFFFATTAFGQKTPTSIEETIGKIENINSVAEAKQLLDNDTSLVGKILSIDPTTDSSAFDRVVLDISIGEIFESKSDDDQSVYLVKAIAWEGVRKFRVSYIYLNNHRLTRAEIDSLRALILGRLAMGEEFSDLAALYSMDGNSSKGGDLGWFPEGMMAKTFEDAVKSHNINEIYTVDLPEQKWFYVVKNTFTPIDVQVLKVLVVRVPA